MLKSPSEHTIQRQCVQWFSLQFPLLDHLLFAIPNGGHRSRVAAGKMKAEGVKRGVADLFLSIPKFPACGLYIEMKTDKGRQTAQQAKFQRDVEALGYQYRVCRSFEEFREQINSYLPNGGRKPEFDA